MLLSVGSILGPITPEIFANEKALKMSSINNDKLHLRNDINFKQSPLDYRLWPVMPN
jgi:hypothetical protein